MATNIAIVFRSEYGSARAYSAYGKEYSISRVRLGTIETMYPVVIATNELMTIRVITGVTDGPKSVRTIALGYNPWPSGERDEREMFRLCKRVVKYYVDGYVSVSLPPPDGPNGRNGTILMSRLESGASGDPAIENLRVNIGKLYGIAQKLTETVELLKGRP